MSEWSREIYDFGSLHRADGKDGDWSISCPVRSEDGRASLSFGLRIINYRGTGLDIAIVPNP